MKKSYDYEFTETSCVTVYDRFIADLGDTSGTMCIGYDAEDPDFERMTERLTEIVAAHTKLAKKDIQYGQGTGQGGIHIDVTARQAADIARQIVTRLSPRWLDELCLNIWYELWYFPPVAVESAYCLHDNRDPLRYVELEMEEMNDRGEDWR